MERVGTRPRAPFAGRDDLTTTAVRFLERIRRGGVAVLLTGEPGIGKTRTIEHLLATPPLQDLPLVRGAATELETDLPFALVSSLFGLRRTAPDGHAAALGELLTSAEHSPDALRLQVADGVVDLLERRTTGEALVVVVDDLHWADYASLAVLDRVVRALDHLQVALLLAARPAPHPESLTAIERTIAASDRGVALTVDHLDEAASLHLAERLLDAEPGPRLLRAIKATAGNPLYLLELLAVTSATGLVDTVDLPEDQLPASLRQVIIDHLGQLPTATLDVLRIASVLGPTFSLLHLALVVDRPELEVISDLQPALDAKVVVESDDRLAFAHDLFQEALYRDQPAAVRAAHHRAVIAALRTAAVPVIDVVPHLLRSDLSSVPDGADLLHEAGLAMRARSATIAADLFSAALEQAGPDVDPRWQMDAVTVLTMAGRTDAARAVLDDLARRPLELFEEPVRDEMAKRFTFAAHPVVGFEDEQAWLDRLEAAGLSAMGAAGVAAKRAWLSWRFGRLDEAHQWADRARERAEDLSDHRLLAYIELVRCRAYESLGAWTDYRDHANRALEHARRADDPTILIDVLLSYGIVMGNFAQTREDAERAIAEAAAITTQLGSPLQGAVDAAAGIHDVRWGAWRRAGARLDAALPVIEDLRGIMDVSVLAQVPARAARLYVHLGDLPLAEQRLQAARALDDAAAAAGRPRSELLLVAVAELEVALAHGDTERGMAAARALLQRARERGEVVQEVIHSSVLLQAFLRGGDQAAAERVVARTREFVGEDGSDDLVRSVERAEARLAGDPDRLVSLVQVMDSFGIPWEFSPQVREEAAEALVAHDRLDEAITLLEEALDLWDTVGARHDVDRVRATLRDLGIQRGRGPATGRPHIGWEALTEAEWRVVQLVQESLVYREIGKRLFISRRTVETHVRHVFRKLDVTSRGELTALLMTDEGQRRLARALRPSADEDQ